MITYHSDWALDSGDHHATYFPVSASNTGGWHPIGDATAPFSTIFEGNGFYIHGLAIRRTETHLGMFGYTHSSAIIRNIRLTNNLADYIGSSNSNIHVGGLVGLNEGTISASHASADADGGNGDGDFVGGLVGLNNGTIIASYATGNVEGGNGITDRAGGLVGENNGGTIIASYATGDADGGDDDIDYAGGLVGRSANGTIIASYATGDADGGDGNDDRAGGLTGENQNGTITASYATGDADVGDGHAGRVGGLVGRTITSTITASYATGDADGGGGTDDYVGSLVGHDDGGTITASYGFGSSMNGENAGVDDSGNRHPHSDFAVGTGVNGARAFVSLANNSLRSPPAVWDQASSNTQNVWLIPTITNTQAPALRYADYDGAGNTYGCGSGSGATIVIPDRVPTPGGVINITCGSTLLDGPQPR